MATFKVKLFKSKTLANGTHPVVLQIVHNRKPTIITLGYSCIPKDWDDNEQKFKRSFQGYNQKNRILREVLNKADETLDKITLSKKGFSIKLFKELFLEKKSDLDFFSFIDVLVSEFEELNKLRNRNVYRTLKNRLIAFTEQNKNLAFGTIDKRFLELFEHFLKKSGCNDGGVRQHMKTLRAVYNKAIERKVVKEIFYPFTTSRKKDGYSLKHLKSTARPRALSLEDMEKIKVFPINDYPGLKQSNLYFLFSYYARGMNFTDMAHLKWTDMYDNRIYYIRSKTQENLSLPLSENLKNILKEFPRTDNDYIFPVLNDSHKTTKQIENRIDKCLTRFNKDLKEIAQLCGIDAKLTSYYARHTFATTLKKKNVDIALISESLAHTNISTTKAYLKKFENAELDELDELL